MPWQKNYFIEIMRNFNNKSGDFIMYKNILFSMMFLISSLLANTLGLENNGDGTWNVSYSSEDIIAGFQFDVDDATAVSYTHLTLPTNREV